MRGRSDTLEISIKELKTNTELALCGLGPSAPSAAAGRIRVLLVEPRLIYAIAIAKCLSDQQFAVQIADSESSAIELIAEVDPDIVVVCVGTSPQGVALLDRMRTVSTPHLIAVADAETGAVAIAAASPSPQTTLKGLVHRIRTTLRGPSPGGQMSRHSVGPSDARHRTIDGLDIDLAANRAKLSGQPITLTRTEFRILAMLFERPGDVVTRRQLQEELWGRSWAGTREALDVHVGNLRRKLNEKPGAPRYVLTVRGAGYRLAI